jgi:uncharacterized protein YggT (Ycf19 family)
VLYLAPMSNIFWILADILQIMVILILVEALLSWAPMLGLRSVMPYTPWVRTLRKINAPILMPFRRLWDLIIQSGRKQFGWKTYALQRIDLSPLLAIIAIQIVQGVLYKAGSTPTSIIIR